jgi:hypothetical protein
MSPKSMRGPLTVFSEGTMTLTLAHSPGAKNKKLESSAIVSRNNGDASSFLRILGMIIGILLLPLSLE